MINSELSLLLNILQAQQNDGRGVSCVRDICLYLDRDDLDSAKNVTATEWDKIRQYPDIVAFFKLHELAPVFRNWETI